MYYFCTILQQYSLCLSLPFSLSQALKEIARVSEELCSYQDEIRKKSVDKRYINPRCYVNFWAPPWSHDNHC